MRHYRYIFLLTLSLVLLGPTTAAAQENDSVGKRKSGILTPIKWLGRFIDTLSVRGIDQNYIEVPKRPWQVILRGNINQSDLKLKSKVNGEELFAETVGELRWEPRIMTDPSIYTGFWAGYRGYGFGYSWNVAGDKGRYLTFGAMGGSYGVNLRIHTIKSDEPEVFIAGTFRGFSDDGEDEQIEYQEETMPYILFNPIRIRTLMLDGYYMFNGKRFSYAAAYDQSTIQRRSAGSFMAGFMYYHSHINYAFDLNADFILMMNDIGRIKQWQGSAGVGYAYNYVPVKGMLISAFAMPMLTLYNRNKIWKYDSPYRQKALDEQIYDDDLEIEDYLITPMSSENTHSNMTFNFDARLSFTYQLGRYFLNAYGQFSNFHYRSNNVKGRLNDWFVNASLGVRL